MDFLFALMTRVIKKEGPVFGIFWRSIVLSLLILFISPASVCRGEDLSADNGFVGMRTENRSAVTLFRLDAQKKKIPFASVKFDSGEIDRLERIAGETRTDLLVQTQKDRIFFSVNRTNKVGRFFVLIQKEPRSDASEKDRTLDFQKLPEIEFPLEIFSVSKTDELRTFGTAGLREINGHQGSYSFLSIVNPKTGSGIVGGWLTNEQGNGILFSGKSEAGLPLMKPQVDYGKFLFEPAEKHRGEILSIGWFDDVRTGLENYADSLSSFHKIKLKPAPTGYCTWYSDRNGGAGSEQTTAEFAQTALKKLVPYGMNFFQIDDKWQDGRSKNGPNKNFTRIRPNGPYPSGMKKTADLLNRHHLTAGLWFMPFSGNFDDPWFAGDRQSWFVKSAIDYPEKGQKNSRIYKIDQKKGGPYETFWGGTCLDTTRPEVQNYITDVVSRIARDWNFKYFKIDGLWTGSATEQLYVNDEYLKDDIGKQIFHDPKITNIAAYRKGLTLVRQAAGDDVFILGCNVSQNMRTLGASVGYVDAMRIGPDNGPSWKGICAGPWRGTNRYFYNARVWWNDPDPVYVRDSIPLEHAQVSASWAALTGQLFAFSDWLPGLSEERVNVLRKTMPNHQRKTVRPIDLFGADLARIWMLTNKTSESADDNTRYVLGLFNWNEKKPVSFVLTPKQLGLPEKDQLGSSIRKYVGFDFWKQQFIPEFSSDLRWTVSGGSCSILAIRPVSDHPVLVSTSRHLTQGIYEVIDEKWNTQNCSLDLTVDLKKVAFAAEEDYRLRIYIPGNFQRKIEKEKIDPELFRKIKTSGIFQNNLKKEEMVQKYKFIRSLEESVPDAVSVSVQIDRTESGGANLTVSFKMKDLDRLSEKQFIQLKF